MIWMRSGRSSRFEAHAFLVVRQKSIFRLGCIPHDWPMRVFLILSALVALFACGSVDYENAPVGKFKGAVLVMWVSEDRFVFVPAPGAPLTFSRANPNATLSVISPELMYTDGGSIPRPARLFNGFSPWGYAPAYMVHDWIFVARHCLTDGVASEAEQGVAQMEFQESAEIIAEAIRTLVAEQKVAPNDVAPEIVSGAVAGPVSYNRWTIKGACAQDRVSEKHKAEVAAALALRDGKRAATSLALPDDEVISIDPARVIAEVSF